MLSSINGDEVLALGAARQVRRNILTKIIVNNYFVLCFFRLVLYRK